MYQIISIKQQTDNNGVLQGHVVALFLFKIQILLEQHKWSSRKTGLLYTFEFQICLSLFHTYFVWD